VVTGLLLLITIKKVRPTIGQYVITAPEDITQAIHRGKDLGIRKNRIAINAALRVITQRSLKLFLSTIILTILGQTT